MSRAKLVTPVYMQFPLFLLFAKNCGSFFYCHYSHTPLHSTNDRIRKNRCVTGCCFHLFTSNAKHFCMVAFHTFLRHRNVMAIRLLTLSSCSIHRFWMRVWNRDWWQRVVFPFPLHRYYRCVSRHLCTGASQ